MVGHVLNINFYLENKLPFFLNLFNAIRQNRQPV